MNFYSSELFENINEINCNKILTCTDSTVKHYSAGEVIMNFDAEDTAIHIIQQGSAILERIDYNGTRYVLEHMSVGDIFGETVAFSNYSQDNYSVICETPCSVICIEREQFTKRCSHACECHSTLIVNLLRIISEKAMRLSERITILCNRTTRDKLLEYLSILSVKSGSRTVTIPFSFADLADYLCVDRSAMMREIKKLNDEGILSSKRRAFTLLN